MWIRHLQEQGRAALETHATPQGRYGLSIMLDTRGMDLSALSPLLQSSKADLTAEEAALRAVKTADGGVAVLPWSRAPEDVRRRIARATHLDLTGREAFLGCHLQHLGEPTVCIVPRGTPGATLVLSAAPATAPQVTTVFLVVEPEAEVEVLEEVGAAVRGYRSMLAAVMVGEGARVGWRVMHAAAEDAVTVSFRRAVLEERARLTWSSVHVGSRFAYEDIETRLVGARAEALTQTLFVCAGTQQADLAGATFHEAPRTTSNLHTKGVVADRAKVLYRGLVDVAANARGANGFQREDTLTLSREAEVDAVPKLEIRTNDVRCTHGVTTSHVDPEQRFYLTSRGIPDVRAQELIVQGFLGQLTKEFPRAFRQRVESALRVKLHA